jgi:hypothetical protein
MVNPQPQRPSFHKVKRYWSAVAARLREEAQGMAGLITHNGERGSANEDSFRTLFSNVLPASVRVCDGEVIDSMGGVSPQTDALVVSNLLHPALFAQTSEKLFPVESVVLAVEVKTTLDSSEVTEIGEKVQKFSALQSGLPAQPVMAVFAHKAGGSPQNVAKWFFSLPENHRPAFFLVNDSAIFGVRDDTVDGGYNIEMPIRPGSGENASYPFGSPHIVDREFWRPVAKPKGEQVRVDHGAAMLSFIKQSLLVLSATSHADIAWLEPYLAIVDQQRVVYSKHLEPKITPSP